MIESGNTFAIDQLLLSETGELRTRGFSEFHAEEQLSELQLFSTEVVESFRAQMIVLIWAYFENLFSSAAQSVASHSRRQDRFQTFETYRSKNRSISLVLCWKRYFTEVIEFKIELDEGEWQRLSDTLVLRNFIAHSSRRPGFPPEERKAEAILRLPGAKINVDGVSISKRLVVESLHFAELVLNRLGGKHWEESESFDLSEAKKSN